VKNYDEIIHFMVNLDVDISFVMGM